MKTMAERWALFERMTVKPGTDPKEVLRLKIAFYSGGTLMLDMIKQASKAKDGGALLALSRELAATLAELTKEHAAGQSEAARARGGLQ
jgi:hypothetical protein